MSVRNGTKSASIRVVMVMKVHLAVAVAAWSSVARAETHARTLASPPRTVHAMPGADLMLVAASDDGRAAATVDSTGAIRLWPRLDATVEPVVITAPRPVALALTHDAHGLSLASLDAAGTVDIVRTNPRGDEHSHVRIDAARPLSQIVAWSSGFVALADDSHLELFDLTGQPTGAIAGTPGTRIRSIVARADHVVTLVERDGAIHAVTLAATDPSPPLAIAPATAVLSPDGLRVAATDVTGTHLVIVELATGIAKPVEPLTPHELITPLGFSTNRELYIAGFGGTNTYRWNGSLETVNIGDIEGPTRGAIAVADRRVIAARGTAIAIHSVEGTKFLGYHIAYTSQIVAAGDGWLVNNGEQAIRTDARFHQRGVVPLPPDGALLLVDDHVALLQQRGMVHAVSLDDGTNLAEIAKGFRVQYEPSTHLIAITDRDVVHFSHYDPASRTTGPVSDFAFPKLNIVWLLDPAVSGGTVAVMDTASRPGQPGRALAVRSVGVSAIDTTEVSLDELDGMVPKPSGIRRANRDGSLVAEIHGGRLRLRGKDGKARWAIDAHNATDVVWNRGGELMLVGAGAARVDVVTGELRERQCGWELELTDNQSFARGDAPLMCDVP